MKTPAEIRAFLASIFTSFDLRELTDLVLLIVRDDDPATFPSAEALTESVLARLSSRLVLSADEKRNVAGICVETFSLGRL